MMGDRLEDRKKEIMNKKTTHLTIHAQVRVQLYFQAHFHLLSILRDRNAILGAPGKYVVTFC